MVQLALKQKKSSNSINETHGVPQNYNRGDGIKQGNGFFDQLFFIEAMDLVRGDGTFFELIAKRIATFNRDSRVYPFYGQPLDQVSM